jgi:hypothetical protein
METQDVMLIIGASAARPKMAVHLVLEPRCASPSAHLATLSLALMWVDDALPMADVQSTR